MSAFEKLFAGWVLQVEFSDANGRHIFDILISPVYLKKFIFNCRFSLVETLPSLGAARSNLYETKGYEVIVIREK